MNVDQVAQTLHRKSSYGDLGYILDEKWARENTIRKVASIFFFFWEHYLFCKRVRDIFSTIFLSYYSALTTFLKLAPPQAFCGFQCLQLQLLYVFYMWYTLHLRTCCWTMSRAIHSPSYNQHTIFRRHQNGKRVLLLEMGIYSDL